MIRFTLRLAQLSRISGRRRLAAASASCLGLLLASLLWAACQAPSVVRQETPIRLGFIAPISGLFGPNVGEPALLAAQLAVEEVNRAGGLTVGEQRHSVELVVGDSQGDPNRAVEAARRMTGRDKIHALVGPLLSTTAIPVASLAENIGLPMITPTASSPVVLADKRWVFRVTFNDTLQGVAMGQFVADEGWLKAAVLYDTATEYSRGLASIFRRRLEHEGGEVVAYESYVRGETDFTKALERIRQQQPDVLLLPNYVSDVERQFEQMDAIGWAPQILGSDAWAPGAVAVDSPAIEGAVHVYSWHASLTAEAQRPFLTTYAERFGAPANGPAGLTYDAFQLLFDAMARGGLEPADIRHHVAATEGFPGLTGVFSFHGNNASGKTVHFLRYVDGVAVPYRHFDPHEFGLDENLIHR